MVAKPYSYKYPSNIISWFFLAKRHRYVRSILHNLQNLDVGCGLFKITSDSIGLDMKGWKNPDKVGSALEIPFEDGSFDSVTLLEVIEHYSGEDQDSIVEEVRRVLKPSGQFILSMPNISPFWGVPYRIVWWLWERRVMYEYLHEHVGMIPRIGLLALLRRHGFKVKNVRRIALLDVVVDCEKT